MNESKIDNNKQLNDKELKKSILYEIFLKVMADFINMTVLNI